MRAILASGVVLGLGATTTLAAWNDSEVTYGDFVASVFAIESRLGDEAGYREHPSGAAGRLSFAPSAEQLSPGATTRAWLTVRTTSATTVAGSLRLSGVFSDSTELASALQYRMVQAPPARVGSGCPPDAFGDGWTYIAGGPHSYVPMNLPPDPPPEAELLPAGRTAVGYCLEVRMVPTASNSLQGENAKLTWQFTGTSLQ